MENKCILFFEALSDPTRRKILEFLESGSKRVSDIAGEFKTTQPNISHHLRILKYADLVKATRKGKEVCYSLNKCCMSDCCQSFFKKFKGVWRR